MCCIYYWVLIWTLSALRVCRISNCSYGWYGVVASAVIGALVVVKRVKKVVFMNCNHGYPLLSQRGPVSVSRGIDNAYMIAPSSTLRQRVHHSYVDELTHSS